VLVLELLVFFSTPILHITDSYYASADLTQNQTITNLEPDFRPANPLLSDETVAFIPWLQFNRDNIRAGKIPLWNPYNDTPHLANYQSAVFSPYSLPFYLLTMRQALLLSAFLKLFGLGFFTFLFLKELNLGQGPALFGASVFMFGGYHITWLGGPHVGAAIVLPAGLYFVERLFKRFAEPAYSRRFALVGLSLSLTAGLLTGHPETFYFCFLPLPAYILFRLANLAFSSGREKSALKSLLALAGQLGLAGILGVGLAALQLLPFLEYLANSATRQLNPVEAGSVVLNGATWPLLFFPNLLGNPSLSYNVLGAVPGFSNFNEAGSQYLGGLGLFMALLGFGFNYRNKFAVFFAGLAGVWLIYAYNLFGLDSLFNLLPGAKLGMVTRSYDLWLFSLSCGAALFLQYLLAFKPSAPGETNKARFFRTASLITLPGIFFLVLSLLAARQLLADNAANLKPVTDELLAYVPGHIWFCGLSFGLGLVVLVGLSGVRSPLIRAGLAALLLGISFLQTGYLLKDYNPTIKDRYFYPQTPFLSQLQQAIGGHRLVILGGDTLLTGTNIMYKLAMPNAFDALWVKYFDPLFQQTLGNGDVAHVTTQFSRASLKLFGVEYVAMPNSWKLYDEELAAWQDSARQSYSLDEIGPGQTVAQTFRATEDQLQSLSLTFNTYDRTNRCKLKLTLEAVATATTVYEDNLQCQKIRNNQVTVLAFPPVPQSKGQEYRLSVSSEDAGPGNAVSLMAKADLGYTGGTLSQGGQPRPGGLVFNVSYNQTGAFRLVGQDNNYKLYRYTESRSESYLVSQAQSVPDDPESFKLVSRPDFDPYKTVVLSQSAAPLPSLSTSTEPGKVTVLSEAATTLKLQVVQNQPAYLVLTRPWYPGWKARVNGLEKPLLRANYAFNAIPLEAGTSQVEFYYDPDSFKYGLLLSLGSALLGLLFLFVPLISITHRR
jgi:hypothetical protein